MKKNTGLFRNMGTKMQKFKLFLISITPLVIMSLILTPIILAKTNFIEIHEITKNLKIIDANRDHNQALDVLEYAETQNVPIPKIIINFDTHSDIYIEHEVSPKYGPQIADWINVLFSNYQNIEELYWVMPIEEIDETEEKVAFAIKNTEPAYFPLFGNTRKEPKYVNPFVEKQPYIQYFSLDTEKGTMVEMVSSNPKTEYDNFKENSRFRKLKVITCTQESLPSFKDKNVILSIDGDYISNSGYDTGGNFENNLNSKEIDAALTKMLKTIKSKNIHPEIISMTLSPHYVPDEDQEQMYNFFQKVIFFSGKKDVLQKYKRGYYVPTTKEPIYKSF